MKKLAIVFSLGLILLPTTDLEACRPPDNFEISITNRIIFAEYSWDASNGPLECSEDEAVEFEFIIQSTPEKCYGQPEGGKDDTLLYAELTNWVGYTDVWNYFFDYNPLEISSTIKAYCGKFSLLEALGAYIFDKRISSVADKAANFAVGTDNTLQFKTGVKYSIEYPLFPVDDRDECQDLGADDGYVTVSMAVFPKVCVLPPTASHTVSSGAFVTIPTFEERQFTCPHFIGFVDEWVGCDNIDDDNYKRYVLQNRICAPTNGRFFLDYPGETDGTYARYKRGGGSCSDLDEDETFANVPGYEMYYNRRNDDEPNDCDEPGYTQSDPDGAIAWPPRNERFYHDLVVVPMVFDGDGVKQFTISIDEIQTEACKKRFYPVLKANVWSEYLLVMDLAACLGTDYGDHVFKIWVVDQCGNVDEETFSGYPFRYVSQSTSTCDYESWGNIDFIDYDSDTHELDYEIAVMDNDGVVFSTLNLNGINEDRCKLRHSYTPNPGAHDIRETPLYDVPVEYCMLKEELVSAQLWVVDKCGNTTMVHNKVDF